MSQPLQTVPPDSVAPGDVMVMRSQPTSVPSPDDLVERLFDSVTAAMDVFAVYLGDKLGFYRALDADGPATSAELARRTSTVERYVREWLEQQAVTGILICDDAHAAAAERRYRMPEGYAAVLVDPDSISTMAPLAQIFAGCVRPLPQLLEAFRSGGGVPYEAYGIDLYQGQAGTTRPLFRRFLAQEWIPAMPDIHARLHAYPAAHVADIGTGLGWSSIAIAQGYPNARIDGFDLDEASVRAARANADAAGVARRVTFHHRDASDPGLAGQYDLALAIECIHDMSNPVAVLNSMRRLVGDGGTVLIVDEKVADRFTAPGDDVERYMYGFSVLHCLPVGMASQPSVATGTVIRESKMRRYAGEAGFHGIDVLPIENDFFRFYRLTA